MRGIARYVQEFAIGLHREESGQDLIEYGLIGALIALAAIVGMSALANQINAAFIVVGNKLSNAV